MVRFAVSGDSVEAEEVFPQCSCEKRWLSVRQSGFENYDASSAQFLHLLRRLEKRAKFTESCSWPRDFFIYL